MIRKKTCVAMLLAGGQGSRLGVLTRHTAKPAVPFGGKYRIIDFPLSNCSNSGIDTVGVLTQWQPLELNAYIGSGSPWDLDLNSGGVYVLPPYQGGPEAEWYMGTANAIYQNLPFLEQYDPDYVLILSGDHIYKMDYADMLRHHINNEADITIAVRPVPWEEASRFGIMNTDELGNIIEFEEKPKNPKSNKASMGIYIFNYKRLRELLIADEANPNSNKDFGKDIIPTMLAAGDKMVAYNFTAYWKDVGTIESLWDANMDLLTVPPPVNLQDRSWRIYARNIGMPPHFTAASGSVENSLITEGCIIRGTVKDSVLSAGVVIEEGAVVEGSVIMPATRIGKNARVIRSIVSENAVVGEGAVVGAAEGDIAVIGTNTVLPEGATVAAGEQVGQ
jgi:glucose-1-phosphate adenylyltransferase